MHDPLNSVKYQARATSSSVQRTAPKPWIYAYSSFLQCYPPLSRSFWYNWNGWYSLVSIEYEILFKGVQSFNSSLHFEGSKVRAEWSCSPREPTQSTSCTPRILEQSLKVVCTISAPRLLLIYQPDVCIYKTFWSIIQYLLDVKVKQEDQVGYSYRTPLFIPNELESSQWIGSFRWC